MSTPCRWEAGQTSNLLSLVSKDRRFLLSRYGAIVTMRHRFVSKKKKTKKNCISTSPKSHTWRLGRRAIIVRGCFLQYGRRYRSGGERATIAFKDHHFRAETCQAFDGREFVASALFEWSISILWFTPPTFIISTTWFRASCVQHWKSWRRG